MTPDSSSLLHWYDHNRRELLWRAQPNQHPEPYHVWLSEIMLQQTTVQTVTPYYKRFLERFPDIKSLAHAPQDEVLQLWAGLGYYARARNLHACAKTVADIGFFPSHINDLLKLPGIGPYTARAIAAIAFNIPVVPVDGNVERVTSRLFNILDPLPSSRPLLARYAATLNQQESAQKRPSDFAQALFDLGATLCTPRNPACLMCPWHKYCQGYQAGHAVTLPRRLPKKPRPNRYGVHFRLINSDGHFLLKKRPPHGLLGGTDELPGSPWKDTPLEASKMLSYAPLQATWHYCGKISHIFSHFTLYIDVYEHHLSSETESNINVSMGNFKSVEKAALSGAMMKCLQIGKIST